MERLPIIIAALLVTLLPVGADAEVLRSDNAKPTVWVFKDADALRRFNKLKAPTIDDGVVAPLMACQAPQGSRIEVRGSGHRTAFVRIIGGREDGCEGTVPLAYVKRQ